jgi:hypothetical protein
MAKIGHIAGWPAGLAALHAKDRSRWAGPLADRSFRGDEAAQFHA